MSVRGRLIRRGDEARAGSPERRPAPGPVTLGGPLPAAPAAAPRPARLGTLLRDRMRAGAGAAGTAGPVPTGDGVGQGPFVLLTLFLTVLYVRPQDLVPPLAALRLAFVLGVGAAALHAIDAARRGAPVVRLSRETWGVTLLLVLGAASVPFALWPGGSFKELVDQLMKVVLAFVLVAHVVDTAGRARALIAVLVASGVYLAGGALYAVSSGLATRYEGRAQGLVGGMFKDPNDLALTLVILIALAGFQALQSRRTSARILCIGAVGVMLAGVLATFSRGGLVALVVATAVGVRRLARHGRGLAVAGLAGLAVLAVFFAPEGYSDRATSIVTRDDRTGSIDARIATLKNGVAVLAAHPVVGVGLGNFRVAEGAMHEHAGKWNEAHNAFLQIGAELGWAGLAVYVALALFALDNARTSARLARGDPRLLALAHGLETALAGFFTGAMFLSQAYTWHFYILLGLTVAVRRIASRQPSAGAALPAAPALSASRPVAPRPVVLGGAPGGPRVEPRRLV